LVPSNLVIALAKLQIGDRRPGVILFRRFSQISPTRAGCAALLELSNI
jgi:hypothetical protein